MLSYYFLCCPVLHHRMLLYITQRYLKLHYITLPCLMSHLISLPLLYPVLDCTTLIYSMFIYASLSLLCHNTFHILMICWVPLPCLALPHITFHYTTSAQLTVANTFYSIISFPLCYLMLLYTTFTFLYAPFYSLFYNTLHYPLHNITLYSITLLYTLLCYFC